MRYLTSNLYFASIVIIGVGMLLWYFLNESPKKEKQSILSVFTDLIFYFLLTLLGLNLLFHFSEVISFPYRILHFSSNIVSIATLLILLYSLYKYGSGLWKDWDKLNSTVQLFLFIGLMNHLYLYFNYRNLQSVLFISYFLVLLLLTSLKKVQKRVDPLLFLIFAGIVHLLLVGNDPVIYFNFAFYPIPLAVMLIALVAGLYYQRRKTQSKLN